MTCNCCGGPIPWIKKLFRRLLRRLGACYALHFVADNYPEDKEPID